MRITKEEKLRWRPRRWKRTLLLFIIVASFVGWSSTITYTWYKYALIDFKSVLPFSSRVLDKLTEFANRSQPLRSPFEHFVAIFPKPGIVEDLPEINLHLSFENYRKIAERVYLIRTREVEKDKPRLILDEDKAVEVKGMIEDGKRSVPIKLRLRGLYLDHLQGKKWSFRIKAKNTFWGMKKFSLQNPTTRMYHYEWLLQKAMGYVGNIPLRYHFVRLKLNGNDLGVYALEEFFEKRLAESNKRREGVFFKFAKNEIRVLDSKHVLGTEKLKRLSELAKMLYIGYRRGSISPKYVFDYEKTAKYFALNDLFGAHHGNIDYNFIAYFNPDTRLFEPIAYDNNANKLLSHVGMYFEYNGSPMHLDTTVYHHPLFRDKEFFRMYLKFARQYGSHTFVQNLVDRHKKEIKRNGHYLQREFVGLNFSSFRNLFENAAYMQSFLSKGENYFRDYHKKIVRESFDYDKKVPFGRDKRVYGDLDFRGEIKELKKPNINPSRHRVEISQEKRSIKFPEKFVVKENIVIGPGWEVIFDPGSEIFLSKNTNIVSSSPLLFKGTKENPIKVSSPIGGGGIFVVQAKGESVIEHTIFDRLSPVGKGRWFLSGGVTFYESDVKINNSVFIKNRAGDDSLNIVRSKVEIENVFFDGANSDALDLDFVHGRISRLKIDSPQNDGLDMSGSDVYLDEIYINGAGDKGISVGEATDASATNVTIQNSVIGVASKDRSIIKINKALLSHNKSALAVYQKKPEFGPGYIFHKSVVFKENQEILKPGGKGEIIDQDKLFHKFRVKINRYLKGSL